MRVGSSILTTFPAVLLLASVSIASPIPTGDDMQVNTFTLSDQFAGGIAQTGPSEMVVVWTSVGSPGDDSAGQSIQGRRLTGDGTPVGAQFQVNTVTAGNQFDPAVATLPGGGFVVVWATYSAGANQISGQTFDAAATPQGGEFVVGTAPYVSQPEVDTNASGDFVVAWLSFQVAGPDTSFGGIEARRYDTGAIPAGAAFQVNTYTTGRQAFPDVAVTDDGAFLVAWRSQGSAGPDLDGRGIVARRFDDTGAATSDDYQVNSYTSGDQDVPTVAAAQDGRFLVTWHSMGSPGTDTDGFSILARQLDALGTPVGSDFQVNDSTTGGQTNPTVAAHPNRDFVVAWHSASSNGSDDSSLSIQGRRLAQDGPPIGGEFQVNAHTPSIQWYPFVAADTDDRFVVAWTSETSAGTDTSDQSVQSRAFRIPIFADGFESGDTSAWDTVVGR